MVASTLLANDRMHLPAKSPKAPVHEQGTTLGTHSQQPPHGGCCCLYEFGLDSLGLCHRQGVSRGTYDDTYIFARNNR